MTRANLQVNLRTFQRKWRIDPTNASKYLRHVWTQLPNRLTRAYSAPVEVSVVLLNDEQIRRYNHQFRKKDRATDVLSFPVNELQDEISRGRTRQIFYLGDILISMEKAASQAREKNHPPEREFKILLLHGMLHLLGYDHEKDTGQMERLERRLQKSVL
jgi:probable rRNA maturation factor